MWTEDQQRAASAEGWALHFVVDEGKPVTSAYLDVFDQGPKFNSRQAAMRFVVGRAHERSVLHLKALAAVSASRMPPAPKRKK